MEGVVGWTGMLAVLAGSAMAAEPEPPSPMASTSPRDCGETVLVRRGMHGHSVGAVAFSCRRGADGPLPHVDLSVRLTHEHLPTREATLTLAEPPSQITPLRDRWVLVAPVPTFQVQVAVLSPEGVVQGPCSFQVGRPHRREAWHPFRFQDLAWVGAGLDDRRFLLTLTDDGAPRVLDVQSCALVTQTEALRTIAAEQQRCAVGVMEGDGTTSIVARCPGEAVKVHTVDSKTGRWSAGVVAGHTP